MGPEEEMESERNKFLSGWVTALSPQNHEPHFPKGWQGFRRRVLLETLRVALEESGLPRVSDLSAAK